MEQILKKGNAGRYPRLDTILLVEEFVRENSGKFKKKQLWEALPKKIMYQTYSLIVDYLIYSDKISIDGEGKFVWEGSKKMRKNEFILERIKSILEKYGIKRAGLFGSYSRGEEKRDSDIDIVIEFKGSLLELIKLEDKLHKLLNKKIDLITYKGINPLLKRNILDEEVRII
jgi:predicted nucleotidyltransferase